MGKLIDLSGQRFGRLTVLKEAGRTSERKALWLCHCDCGNNTVVIGTELRQGRTQSCGCYRKELLNSFLKQRIMETCDGHSMSRLYRIWQQMKMRCYNPNNTNFAYYGGRGIQMCEEWKEWEQFRIWAIQNGYQEGLTIDRIDVNGNYEPLNCRWVNCIVQANNTTRNVRISYQGEIHTISEWARIIDVPVHVLNSRLRYGWSVERALTEPIHKKKAK